MGLHLGINAIKYLFIHLPKMELLSIALEHKPKPSGIFLPRNQAIQNGAWCMTTNIFVINSKGELLCHQRSKFKDRMPGCWMTHLGGHVCHGESYESNAEKELHEESGINVEPNKMIPWRISSLTDKKIWAKDFVYFYDGSIGSLTPQEKEVDKFEWMSFEDVLFAQEQSPKDWYAGVHNLRYEYWSIRTALSVAAFQGKIELPEEMMIWKH